MAGVNQFITVQPEELKFRFELEKQSYCDLKVSNSTENHVAFKVKTTSPKKYFVRPNTGIIHPGDSCVIRVTLQAQKEYPPDMQCKDKFLLQSTVVSAQTELDDLPQDTFLKDSGRAIEECKLKVLYIPAGSGPGDSDEETVDGSKHGTETSAAQRLKDERDAIIRQTQQLKQELDVLKKRRWRNDAGFSIKFALLVGIIGIMVGFLSKLLFSSPPAE